MKAGLFPLVWMLSAAKLQPPFSSPALRSFTAAQVVWVFWIYRPSVPLSLSLSLFRPHVASDEAYVCTQLWLVASRLLGEHERAVEAQATYVAMDVPLPVATTGAGGAPGLKEAGIRVFVWKVNQEAHWNFPHSQICGFWGERGFWHMNMDLRERKGKGKATKEVKQPLVVWCCCIPNKRIPPSHLTGIVVWTARPLAAFKRWEDRAV